MFIILICGGCAQDQNNVQIAPLNPKFVEFMNQQEELLTPKIEEAGYPKGLIPSPLPPIIHSKDVKTLFKINILGASAEDSKYDLRDPNDNGDQSDNLHTPVRDQGSCSTCWAFATYGMLESQLKKDYNLADSSNNYSEDNLKQRHGFDRDSCSGGNLFMATAYLSRYTGPVHESVDPYQDTNNSDYCTNCGPMRYIDNIVFLPARADTSDNDYIKQAIIDHGALYSSMYYDSNYYDSVSHTYYYDGNNDDNHAIVIIGWDDNRAVSEAPEEGAFIIRNSWGTDFGENGYFYISYYDTVIAFEDLAYSDDKPEFDFDYIYYYDSLGMTNACGGSNTLWGANWFEPNTDGQIVAVGFYATDAMSYEIKVYDDFSDGQFSNQLGSTKSGAVEARGCYTIQLDKSVSVSNGDGFGVMVKFNTPGYNYPIPMEKPVSNYASCTANSGESFISSNGTTFTDITTYFENTNICIKALINGKDELVFDFNSPYGIYVYYNNTTWSRLHKLSPEIIASCDMDGNGKDDLIIDFGSVYGIYVFYNDSTWKKLHSFNPEIIAACDMDGNGKDDLIIDFGPTYGIYVYYNDATWRKLHDINSEIITSCDIDGNGMDDLIIDFGSTYGIYVYYNNATWKKLHSLDPESIVSSDMDDNSTDDLIIDFGSTYGIYIYYNDDVWKKIHDLSPDGIISCDMDDNTTDDLIIDFGSTYGIYIYYNDVTWKKLHSFDPENIISCDMDDNSIDDLIIDFGSAYGIYVYYNDTTWRHLHDLSHSCIAFGNIDD